MGRSFFIMSRRSHKAGSRNSAQDQQRIRDIRSNAQQIVDTTYDLGVEDDTASEDDAMPAKALTIEDLRRRLRLALVAELGEADVEAPAQPDGSLSRNWWLHQILPMERVAIVRDEASTQLWRIPFLVNADDTISLAPRNQWDRVTTEFLPAVPPQPSVLRRAASQPVALRSLTDEHAIVGGYGIVWDSVDLYGERFTRSTGLGTFLDTGQVPVYYDHTLEKPQHPLGRVIKTVVDDYGLWVEAQLERHEAYVEQIISLIQQKKLGWSSGSSGHLVRVEQGVIKHWPVAEFSLTPTPAEPNTLGVQELITATARTAPQSAGEPMSLPNQTGQQAVDGQSAPTGSAPTQQQAPTPAAQPDDGTRASVQPSQQQAPTQNLAPAQPAPMLVDPQAMRSMFGDVVNEAIAQHVAPLAERLERIEQAEPVRSTGTITAPDDAAERERAAVRSFDIAVRHGINSPQFRAEGINTQIGSEGGFLLPTTVSDQMVVLLKEMNSVIRTAGARVQRMPGYQGHTVPSFTNSARAEVIPERGTFSESKPNFGNIRVTPFKYGKLITATHEQLQNPQYDVVGQFIMPDAAYAFVQAENEDFVTGDGVNAPQGLITGGTVGHTTTGASIKYDDVITLQHALPQYYRDNAVWITNDSTIGALRKLKDGNGNSIWMPGLVPGTPETILGRPVITLNTVPSVEASAKVLIFANLMFYWIYDFANEQMLRLDQPYATQGRVGFQWFRWVDARVVNAEAVQVLQMSA